MISNKWYITDSFSKYSEQYDTHALIQKRASSKFAEHVKNKLDGVQPRFLELGCGTGLVTEALMNFFPASHFHITDISNQMLQITFSKTQAFQDVVKNFEELDAEEIPEYFSTDADVIVSGFTLQWFHNPLKTIINLFKQIPECEQAYFSFLGLGSFPEWKQFAKQANVPFSVNALPDEIRLEESLKEAGFEVQTTVQWMSQVYPNALSFFNSIKHIGSAHNMNDQTMNPAQMRRLLRTWDKECKPGVEVRHKVVFLDIERI